MNYWGDIMTDKQEKEAARKTVAYWVFKPYKPPYKNLSDDLEVGQKEIIEKALIHLRELRKKLII